VFRPLCNFLAVQDVSVSGTAARRANKKIGLDINSFASKHEQYHCCPYIMLEFRKPSLDRGNQSSLAGPEKVIASLYPRDLLVFK